MTRTAWSILILLGVILVTAVGSLSFARAHYRLMTLSNFSIPMRVMLEDVNSDLKAGRTEAATKKLEKIQQGVQAHIDGERPNLGGLVFEIGETH